MITISPNCKEVEFHVHIDGSLLVISVMLTQNIILKNDQHIVYASRLLKNVDQNYSIIECEALVMVFPCHKFKHYLLGKRFFSM